MNDPNRRHPDCLMPFFDERLETSLMFLLAILKSWYKCRNVIDGKARQFSPEEHASRRITGHQVLTNLRAAAEAASACTKKASEKAAATGSWGTPEGYRLDKCDPPAPRDEHEARDLDRLLFVSRAVGLSTITPANVREWLVRLLFTNLRLDLDLVGPGELGVIQRWIGLETNVEEKTREEFLLSHLWPLMAKAENLADETMSVPA